MLGCLEWSTESIARRARAPPIGANLRFFFNAISNHAASSAIRNGRGARPSSQARTAVS